MPHIVFVTSIWAIATTANLTNISTSSPYPPRGTPKSLDQTHPGPCFREIIKKPSSELWGKSGDGGGDGERVALMRVYGDG